MTYEEVQVVSQLVAGGLFLAVLIGVAIYAFKPSNKSDFEHMARLPLETDKPQEK